MNPTLRSYQSEDDFWRMRQFLRQVFLLNQRLEVAWHVARLDYARWHTTINCAGVSLDQVTYLWEADGELVAILMPDGGPGEAHFLVHPAWQTPALDAEMLSVAEERLPKITEQGLHRLFLWTPAADGPRRELFRQRGYLQDDWPEYQWRRDLDEEIPPTAPPAGYTIRPLGDGLELLERCYASGLGFHAGDIRVAVDNRADPTWYRNIQTAPLYRRDLDLVAVHSDGSIAAFCTIWFDDVTRSAIFEPVAAVPTHQRRGLGKAIMTEGLRRLQRMGCTRAFVGGYSLAANALYRAVMGGEHEISEVWVREW